MYQHHVPEIKEGRSITRVRLYDLKCTADI